MGQRNPGDSSLKSLSAATVGECQVALGDEKVKPWQNWSHCATAVTQGIGRSTGTGPTDVADGNLLGQRLLETVPRPTFAVFTSETHGGRTSA